MNTIAHGAPELIPLETALGQLGGGHGIAPGPEYRVVRDEHVAAAPQPDRAEHRTARWRRGHDHVALDLIATRAVLQMHAGGRPGRICRTDRKSTRLNSSHRRLS